MNTTGLFRTASLFALGLALFLASSGCQQKSQVPVDPAAAKELCTRLWSGYLDTIKGLQGDKIAAWFTKDAVLIYPDMPELRSRDSIQPYLVKGFASIKKIEFTFTLSHFEVVGSKAYTFATLDELVTSDGQPPARKFGRCGVVWQQQADNTWQISHFLINYFAPQVL